jgi:hypothetical protein
VDETLIHRERGGCPPLFRVSDIAESLERIETLLEDDNGEEEADQG